MEGAAQAPPRIYANASAVRMVWEGVVSEHGGLHPGLTITLGVSVAAGGGLRWSAHIDNRCNETLENFYWPYWSVRPPSNGTGVLEAFMEGYSNPNTWPLFPSFPNGKGYQQRLLRHQLRGANE